MGPKHGRHQLVLAVGVPVDQGDPGRRRRILVGQEGGGESGHPVPGLPQVGAPDLPSVLPVDPAEEAGYHLAQLDEHHVGVRAGLGEGRGPHAQEQLLVALPGAVDAEVGLGGRGQQAPDGVEGLGLHRRAPDEVAVARPLGVALGEVREEQWVQLGVGVEQPVHVAHVAGSERRLKHVRAPVVAVAAVGAPGVVGHVAGALLEVRHEPAPLEDLGQQVRGLLTGQVHPAELGHRVVAVLEEDPLVELLGPVEADGGVDGLVAGDVELAHELVEEQPPQALGAAAVTGEQGSLHHLGQVHQGEHRLIEVRDVPPEDGRLVGGELLSRVRGHGRSVGPAPRLFVDLGQWRRTILPSWAPASRRASASGKRSNASVASTGTGRPPATRAVTSSNSS